MSKVVVLATGGTIASRNDSSGNAVAADDVSSLLASVAPSGIRVEGRDVLTTGSYLLTPDDQLTILRAIADASSDPDVSGVVVTHGTDTMEETAYLCDLHQAGDRPVVFTGAQLAADSEVWDGARNLSDAVAVAAAPTARGIGTVIVFHGRILPAAGTRKCHTTALDAFDNGAGGVLGHVRDGVVAIDHRPERPQPLPLPDALPRVDIVAVHPGADRTLLDAAVEAGARGMVIVGTGVGNANPSFVAATQDCIAAGIPVIVGTRVPNGDIVARYGNGGGADLADRGVLPAGLLRPAQARILLASALAVAPVSEIANIVRSHTHPTVATPATSHSSHR
ncbi:asparaginase [Prescottella equi]|uniref:asparaginase n=1 Tax=Rhodococcus hoagii TaxID=43767 RepID=UPI001EEC62FF|nr:asparaginase [Prescottella equi]